MLEKGDQIEQFLTLCESSPFPHRDELVRGISTGEYRLERLSASGIPSKQLLEVYGVRARMLGDRILSNELKGVHAERLLSDTRFLVEALRKVPDESINFWSFSIDEASEYLAFEGINCERVLGCILTVDKRKISEDEWETLWGKSKGV